MGKKRTPLGTELYIVLMIKLVMVVISALYALASVAVIPEDLLPVEIKGILFAVTLLAMGVYILICRRYLVAFDNNEPQKIMTITKVMFAAVVLVFAVQIIYLNFLKDPKLAQYGFQTITYINYGRLVLDFVLCIAAYAILFYELIKDAKGNVTSFDKWLWLPVLAINLYFFMPTFIRYCKGGVISTTIAASITLIFVASQALIACWITNPEKFYVDENQSVVPPAGIV